MADEITVIENECLKVRIKNFGAEIISVTDKEGREYMWSGDKSVWGYHAPIVFPICGALKDGRYTLSGKSYELGKHGFARFLDYEPESLSKSSAAFHAKGLDEYKESYPFSYGFSAVFSLSGNTLSVTYKVENKDDKTMYFSAGSHEGYACPGKTEDYVLEFEKEETLFNYLLSGSLLSGERELLAEKTKYLSINGEMLKKRDSLIFRDLSSESVTLRHKNGNTVVTVRFPGQKNLVIWSFPDGGYICIEPWSGVPDSVDSTGNIEEKDAIIALEKGKTKEITHYITFGE